MAVEKLREGISKFAADAVTLKDQGQAPVRRETLGEVS
jgi:hypothetical protein